MEILAENSTIHSNAPRLHFPDIGITVAPNIQALDRCLQEAGLSREQLTQSGFNRWDVPAGHSMDAITQCLYPPQPKAPAQPALS